MSERAIIGMHSIMEDRNVIFATQFVFILTSYYVCVEAASIGRPTGSGGGALEGSIAPTTQESSVLRYACWVILMHQVRFL